MSIQVTVKGNLGKDPELKFVGDNLTPLVTFTLAYTPREKKGTEWVDGETMWFKVAQFGQKAEALMDHLAQGTTVIVSGTMKQFNYTAKDGAEKSALEINASDVGIVPRSAKKKVEVDEPGWN